MKRHPKISRILSVLLCAALALSLVPAASAANLQPARSSNASANEYVNGRRWSATVKSHLYENGSGGLTRVEYIDGTVVVEDYDSALILRASRTIPVELPIWGGFFAGEKYNFLMFGQSNEEENDNKEVIRIVKYSKDWQRLGSAGLYGANTIQPFDAGSARFAEYNGYLYVRTCHKMYTSSDGLNHQANVMINVRQSDMTVTDSFTKVMNVGYGYVSHSFNQFILIDQEKRIVALDHGDVNTRAAVLLRYSAKAGQDSFMEGKRVPAENPGWYYTVYADNVSVRDFPDAVVHYNDTGAALGGFAETSNGYVTAYNFDGTASNLGADPRDVYLAFTDKEMSNTTTVKLSTGMDTSVPVLAPTGLDGGYVMWNGRTSSSWYSANCDNTLRYARYDANGNVGTVQTAQASLSGCAPILWKGKVVWYTTSNSVPTFYLLDETGVRAVSSDPSSPFSDVPESHDFYSSIRWAVNLGITTGTGGGAFTPNRTCTKVEILTFLWRAAGRPASAFQAPVSTGTAEFDRALNWAQSKGMLDAGFDPYADCTRADAVTYLWQAAGSPTIGTARFDDVPSSAPYARAVSWAVAQGVTNGAGNNQFLPDRTCTRGEIVTFLYRAQQ